MATGGYGMVLRQLDMLYRVGSVGGMTDGELLDRFLVGREGGEAAFAALVDRHGPMVLRVCRQMLGDPHDAEDAFQATFLVLVRRARTIARRESLASWLHGVARRVAMRARVESVRRRARESARAGSAAQPPHSPAGDELRALLHDEIDRLPEKYRAPLVLCELEGRSHAEAAERLQWPVGTVSGRLSRARDLLRGRMVRRGLVPTAGALAAILSPSSAPAAVRPSLAAATAKAASRFVAGRAPGTAAEGLALVAGQVGYASGLLKLAAGVVLAAGMVAGGARGLGRSEGPSAPPALAVAVAPEVKASPAESTPPPAPEREEPASVTALAFAPDGKTLASGGRDTTVKLWDVDTGRVKSTLTGHTGPIVGLAFAADGRTLASADLHRTLKFWDVDSGLERLSMTWVDGADGPRWLVAEGALPATPDAG